MDSIVPVGKITSIALNKPWKEFALDTEAIDFLAENVFYDYMRKCRWFAGKARMIKFLKVQQLLDIPVELSTVFSAKDIGASKCRGA